MRSADGTQGVGAPPGIAFFDVDETLIGPKSMFSFLEFYLRNDFRPPGTYERAAAQLRGAARRGLPREEVNRLYYRLLRGESVRRLRSLGREWFAEAARDPGFWHSPVLERLHHHRARGELVVLVSGSFFGCLEPVSEAVGAHWTLGTRPVVRVGRLTGEVLVPVIGETKGAVARTAMALLGAEPGRCSAYGDHASDLSLLKAVGAPHVVGDDPVLNEHAHVHGWARIPRSLEPPPVFRNQVAGVPDEIPSRVPTTA
ncbi:HAD family hydrolase [Nocardiopsis halotolerans]|uniref:HAD family hydrolase n=1 Tax=Nocardiopsis halotolerans TaxID=124252 RepID=UPI00034502AE|nr:HAD-IB family hydrolase [Nocardiopsis halotolerans]